MGSVQGTGHGMRPTMQGAGWQCPICNTLVVGSSCPTCGGDPNWRPPARPGAPTGPEAARAAMAALGAQQAVKAAEAYDSTVVQDFHVRTEVNEQGASVLLSTTTGDAYSGQGITLQEAMSLALAAMEEDLGRPHCPLCGQKWPEGKPLPDQLS